MRIMEPQQMLTDSNEITTGGTVNKSDGSQANESSDFPPGGDGHGDVSDSKHGNYNPWTAWDDMPVWE